MPDPSKISDEHRVHGASPMHLTRRGFLRIAAGMSIVGLAGRGVLENFTATQAVRRTRMMMGTVVNLTLLAPDRDSAPGLEKAAAACLDHMARLESALSRFQFGSDVSTLNRTGRLRNPHPALRHLVDLSLRIGEYSDGVFDITILPILRLYEEFQRRGASPAQADLDAALRKVDFRRLDIDRSGVAFATSGMSLTLDGIAKGYIVDEGMRVLVEHGFNDVLLEAGGDLFAGGARQDGQSWHVGIRAPRSGGEALAARIEVGGEAVATSGDYMQTFSADFSDHHIINPRSGHSPSGLASATVIAPSLALADALATTLMLMEPAAGLALAKRLGCRAILFTKDLVQIRG